MKLPNKYIGVFTTNSGHYTYLQSDKKRLLNEIAKDFQGLNQAHIFANYKELKEKYFSLIRAREERAAKVLRNVIKSLNNGSRKSAQLRQRA